MDRVLFTLFLAERLCMGGVVSDLATQFVVWKAFFWGEVSSFDDRHSSLLRFWPLFQRVPWRNALTGSDQRISLLPSGFRPFFHFVWGRVPL